MTTEEHISPKEIQRGLFLAFVAFMLLSSAVYLSYRHTKSRTPQIILPGGVTYLGPPKENPAPPKNTEPTQESSNSTGKIPVPDNASWSTWKGQKYPYSFSYPTSLSLGFFPNDPFDAVTIFWQNTNASENLLIRVEDLSQNNDSKQYVNKSKREYIDYWWKQYAYTGIQSVKEFTTTTGFKGYRAEFTTQSGNPTPEQIFLEIPSKPNLVVWMNQKLLNLPVFDKIVNSFLWKETK